MAEIKDFGGSFVDDREPIIFKLYGEDFECVKAVQGKMLLDFTKKSNSEDPADQAELINDFFSQVLLDESYERFETLLKSKDKIVPVETLGEITGWIVEQLTSRPEEQPEAS